MTFHRRAEVRLPAGPVESLECRRLLAASVGASFAPDGGSTDVGHPALVAIAADVPESPGSLIAYPVRTSDGTYVTGMNWTRAPNASVYIVERREGQGPWVRLASGNTNGNVFTDLTAELGRRYTYRVVAVNSAGESAPSLVASVVVVPGLGSPLKDINPKGRSDPAEMTQFGDHLYFSADDSEHGRELWRTDGTAAGTVLVKDINPGPGWSGPGWFVPFQGALYFSAGDPEHGRELWKTDGTPEGTVLVADADPGPASSNAAPLVATGDALYFASPVGPPSGGVYLWKTDGTAAGTTRVSDVPIITNGAPKVSAVGDTVYFQGTTPDYGRELWKTDGTEAGTVLVHDSSPGPAGSDTLPPVGVGGVPYFVAKDEEGFTTLYRADGADGGIVALDRFVGADTLVDFNGTLFFGAMKPDTGIQIWKSDGTPEGTVPVADLPGGWGGSFVVSGDVAYFIGDGLYRTDGTAEGTVRLTDVYDNRTTRLTGGGAGAAYFNYSDSLFRTDGTPDGTTFIHPLKDTFTAEIANSRGLLDGMAFFLGDLNGTGRELFKVAETPPAAPADAAVSLAPTGPVVTWHDVPDDEAGFIIERSQSPDFASAEPAGWAPPFAESFADVAYLSGTTYYYRVRAYNAAGDSGWALAAAPVTTAPPVTVAGRNVFYNGTKFDGPGPGGNEFDDRAVDAGKRALLPGQTATPANVTGFVSGINGIMIDLAGLGGRAPGVSDFAFRVGTDPDVTKWQTVSLTNTGDPHQPAVTLTMRRGAGAGGSDRVTLVIPDAVIKNTWLEVTVLPGTHTGLSSPDVFYFGNLVGETGGGAGGPRVTALDLGAIKKALNQTVPVTSPVDVNHDGRVNASDLSIAKANLNRSLPLLSAPPQDPAVTATVFPSMDAKDRPTGTRDDEATDLLDQRRRVAESKRARTNGPGSLQCRST